jgi:acyl-CoA synthetase (AMP-forming)/AMP-acid ligase II
LIGVNNLFAVFLNHGFLRSARLEINMAQLAHELVDAAALWAPSATALRHGAERISYAGLAGAISAFAGALGVLGLGSGERVAVRLPGATPAVVAFLGASGAGCAFVPLDPQQDQQACVARLRDSGARVLVTDAAGLALLADGLANCPALRAIVVHGGCAPRAASIPVLAWDGFLASSSSSSVGAGVHGALGALIYSALPGGEKGERALALSQRNLVAGAASTARCLGIRPGDRVLAALPFHSDYGVNILLAALSVGATVVLDDAGIGPEGLPDPAPLARLLERGEITALAALPATWNALAAQELGRAADCLRYAPACRARASTCSTTSARPAARPA